MTQATDSSYRFKRSFQSPALHACSRLLNTWTGMGGEGVEPEIIFSIAIHKPAPQKLLQLGRYLLLEIVGVVRR
jgi:hypothetical protein